MRLNADFTQRVLMRAGDTPWVPSPMPGVERKMLDRIGDEVARATSIVRYAPGSAFSPHVHDGGEEFVVLDGVFQDEHGDFPKGTYVRNPPTSRHTPAAAQGAVILVKLHQFDPGDRTEVTVDTQALPTTTEPGLRRALLHRDSREVVCIETWDPGAHICRALPGGAELFILEGTAAEHRDMLARWDWLRLPPGAMLDARAGPEGTRLWIKTGHLQSMIDT
jgi:hypothetical protein